MPDWATRAHADLAFHSDDEGGQHGVNYDIDHPVAHTVLRRSLEGLASRLGCRDNLLGWEVRMPQSMPWSRRARSCHAWPPPLARELSSRELP